jgi:hypothetical protein
MIRLEALHAVGSRLYKGSILMLDAALEGTEPLPERFGGYNALQVFYMVAWRDFNVHQDDLVCLRDESASISRENVMLKFGHLCYQGQIRICPETGAPMFDERDYSTFKERLSLPLKIRTINRDRVRERDRVSDALDAHRILDRTCTDVL